MSRSAAPISSTASTAQSPLPGDRQGRARGWLKGPWSQTGKDAKTARMGRKSEEAALMESHYIIKKPILTEKSTFAMNEQGQYSFLVDRTPQGRDQARHRDALQGQGRRREHAGPQGQAASLTSAW
jgi:hypothetical protein